MFLMPLENKLTDVDAEARVCCGVPGAALPAPGFPLQRSVCIPPASSSAQFNARFRG